MANKDKTDDGEIISLDERRAKKNAAIQLGDKLAEQIAKRKQEPKLKLTSEDLQLLEKVRQQEGGNISARVIFLKALSVLCQINEARANGGMILVAYNGSDEPPVELVFKK